MYKDRLSTSLTPAIYIYVYVRIYICIYASSIRIDVLYIHIYKPILHFPHYYCMYIGVCAYIYTYIRKFDTH